MAAHSAEDLHVSYMQRSSQRLAHCSIDVWNETRFFPSQHVDDLDLALGQQAG